MIGKIVEEVYISESEEQLAFLTDDGECHVYTTSGDCCNWVWFHHFNGIDVLLEQRVREVESTNWKEVTGEYAGGDSHEEACIWVLKTNRGYIDIEVRNNHNGYYGGGSVTI